MVSLTDPQIVVKLREWVTEGLPNLVQYGLEVASEDQKTKLKEIDEAKQGFEAKKKAIILSELFQTFKPKYERAFAAAEAAAAVAKAAAKEQEKAGNMADPYTIKPAYREFIKKQIKTDKTYIKYVPASAEDREFLERGIDPSKRAPVHPRERTDRYQEYLAEVERADKESEIIAARKAAAVAEAEKARIEAEKMKAKTNANLERIRISAEERAHDRNLAEAAARNQALRAEAQRVEAEKQKAELATRKQQLKTTLAEKQLELQNRIEDLKLVKQETGRKLFGKSSENVRLEREAQEKIDRLQAEVDVLIHNLAIMGQTGLPRNVLARVSQGLQGVSSKVQDIRMESRNLNKYSTRFQFVIPPPKEKGTISQDTKFSSYQYLPIKRMAAQCRNMPGILLFHSMGSGKTRTALGIAASLTKKHDSVTIVVPKGLQVAWTDEMKELEINTVIVGDTYEQLNEGKLSELSWPEAEPNTSVRAPERAKNLESVKNVPIYGHLLKEGDPLNATGIPKKEGKFEFRYNIITYDKLLTGNYKEFLKGRVVIFDEAHNLLPIYKNTGCDETGQYRLKLMIESCKRIIFLSGTPIQTEMTDLAILVNLSQKRSTDPLISELPNEFKEMYYPAGAGEGAGFALNQINNFIPGGGWAAVLGLGISYATGFAVPAVVLGAATVLAGATGLATALSVIGADSRKLDTAKLALHASPYISYFDVLFETPENKTKYPYMSKRYTTGKFLTYQSKLDSSWKEGKITYNDEVIDYIYWNAYLYPDAKTVEDAISQGIYVTTKPYAISRPNVHGLPAEGADEEGPLEVAIGFDEWQQTVWVSQFMNLEKDTIDIGKMLDTYNQDLADTFGESINNEETFKKLTERLILKPNTVKEFMEKMRVITNLSKYCFYFEPTMDEEEDADIKFYNDTITKDTGKIKREQSQEAKNKELDEKIGVEKDPVKKETMKRQKQYIIAARKRQPPIEPDTAFKGNRTFVTKLKTEWEGRQVPTDPTIITSLPMNYTDDNIFSCRKFEEVLNRIVACRITYHFIPLVYSNFDTYGFKLFSAFLNNRGFKHLIIHSSDEFSYTNQKILELSQQPFPRIGSSKPKDPAAAAQWKSDNAKELEHYETYLQNYPNPKNEDIKRKALLRLVKERDYNPMCILLHPDIKEGLSFKMQPEMMVLEVPLGIGNRDQIYARVIRALDLTGQGNVSDDEYYQTQPTPKLDSMGNQEIQDGEPVMWPGVVLPQYIMHGIFLQENMIAYREEKTPEFTASASGENVNPGMKQRTIDAIIMLRNKAKSNSLSLMERIQLSAYEVLVSRLGGIKVDDLIGTQKAHKATVPRVKKIIHQFVGADTLPRIPVPEGLRKLLPFLPSSMRFSFLPNVKLEKDCYPDKASLIEIAGVRAQLNMQIFKQNWQAYWSYVAAVRKGNPKIGTKTFWEYLAAMPVPWMTITPDDWVTDENTKQQDAFSEIKIAFYKNERKGAEAATPPPTYCAEKAITPDTTTCIPWESPQKPGTCRDILLIDIKGGTPSAVIERDTKTRKEKQQTANRKPKPIVPVENLRKYVQGQGSKDAVGQIGAIASKALLKGTIVESLMPELEAFLTNTLIPQAMAAAEQGTKRVDVQALSAQARQYLANVAETQGRKISSMKERAAALQQRLASAAEGAKPALQAQLASLQSQLGPAETAASAAIAAAKRTAQGMIDAALEISGVRSLNDQAADDDPVEPQSPAGALPPPAVAAPPPAVAASPPASNPQGGFRKRFTYPKMKKANQTRKGHKKTKTYKKRAIVRRKFSQRR